MSNLWASLVCATVLWAVGTAAVVFDFPKRPVGEAWIVTASDKMASRPMLVRAAVPFKVAAQD
jgi:hypothetical protein